MNLFKVVLIAGAMWVFSGGMNAYAIPESGFVPIGRGFKHGKETLHLVSVGRRDTDGYRGFDRVQFYYQNTVSGEKSIIGPSVYLFGDATDSAESKKIEMQLQGFYEANGLKRGRGGANYLAVTKMVYRDLFRGDLDAGEVLGLGLVLYVTGMVMKNAVTENFDVKLDKSVGAAFIAAAPIAIDLVFAPFRWIVAQLTSRERFNYLKSGEFKPLREVALENWALRPQRLRSKVFKTLKSALESAGTDALFDQVAERRFDCGVDGLRFMLSERISRQIYPENRRGSGGTDNPWHRFPYAWNSRAFIRDELLSRTSLELGHRGAWRIDGQFDVETASDEKKAVDVCLSVALDHPLRTAPLLTRVCERVQAEYGEDYPIHAAMKTLAREWIAQIPGGLACEETRR